MGKGNKHVLKPPKLKSKTYYQPSRDETFVLVINPPREQRPDGQMVPNTKYIQTWLSAMTGKPHGVAVEMYTIKTHPEPIIKLEDVDLATTPILGLHHWREFILGMQPGNKLWDQQTVIAEYDVKRCNHPKHIQYQVDSLGGPDPQMYAGVAQPYPRPHAVDLSRDDLGFQVSGKARQTINWSSFPRPLPDQPQNPDAPRAGQDPRLAQAFDGIDREMEAQTRAESKADDPRRKFTFDGIKQEMEAQARAESKTADPRRSFVFDGIDQEMKAQARAESKTVDSGRGSAIDGVEQDVKVALREESKADVHRDRRDEAAFDGQVKQEDVPVKREDVLVKQEYVQVKQEAAPVKQEGIASDGDPLRRVVSGNGINPYLAASQATAPKTEPVEDVKPFASYSPDTNSASVRVKDEGHARPFSDGQTRPKADPDAVSVKQEHSARPAEFRGIEDGRGTFPRLTSSASRANVDSRSGDLGGGNQHSTSIKRERLEEDAQAPKRLKTEH